MNPLTTHVDRFVIGLHALAGLFFYGVLALGIAYLIVRIFRAAGDFLFPEPDYRAMGRDEESA